MEKLEKAADLIRQAVRLLKEEDASVAVYLAEMAIEEIMVAHQERSASPYLEEPDVQPL